MKKNRNHLFLFAILIATFFGSCTKNEVTKITLDQPSLDLILGQVDSLHPNVEYTGDIIPSITYTSSHSDVVKVSNGEIQALKKGSAVITAQAGSKTATCNVTVSNEIIPILTKGELWYWGDDYETGKSNNFLACLAGPDINMENLSGNDDIMYLEFNTELSVKTYIPSGIYEISDSYEPGTMVPGWVESSGNPWGTWFFGNTYNDAVSGFVQVTNNNNGSYAFVLNLVDYFGNNITGTYQIALQYFDYSDEQIATVNERKTIKQWKDAKHLKFIRKH